MAAIAVLSSISVAAGGDINGKIVAWAGPAPHRHLAVVWLAGMQPQTPPRSQPVMAQHGGQFVPDFLVVVAGQTVSMPNEDEVAHNVYSSSEAKQFNLGFYAKGDPKTVTFDRPGLVDVRCLLHQAMRAEILVVPTPYYARVAPDGSFHIRNVPGGAFSLSFWGDGMASFEQGITVPSDGKPISVSLALPGSP
ncbi:MAG: carboxypeptidase regulatory-like domain-containing protein [Candidatus Sulfotelmatobacter sp.]